MTKLKITWNPLVIDEIDVEEHFGMTYEEFKQLTKEEQDEVEWDAIDNIREQMVIQVKSKEYIE
ncbi:MAG: hypothetical protein GY735_23725 [Delftia sp.]|nr:hypothetical protein [Delftia sp.]